MNSNRSISIDLSTYLLSRYWHTQWTIIVEWTQNKHTHTQTVCVCVCVCDKNKIKITLSGGSLGSWVDEERSKLREFMWTAGHMNIDILNAYCGLYWHVSFLRKLYRPHMVEGCIIMLIELVRSVELTVYWSVVMLKCNKHPLKTFEFHNFTIAIRMHVVSTAHALCNVSNSH